MRSAAALGLLLLLLLLFLGGLLVFVAAFTLVERKLMGLQQRREGPDRVGFEGLGQPFADGLKLLRKETLRPKDTPEDRLFRLAPLLSLWVSLLLWSFIPFSSAGALLGSEMGLLLLLGLASLGSYGVIYAGWASNSKYALLGAFRAVAQFVSYEILFSVLFLPLLALSGSANLLTLVQQQQQQGWFGYLVPLWLLAFLVVLAETNRTPFDLPEAEAELVAGFNVEYSSLAFAFFFLAEYSAMGFFAALLVTLFFGGYAPPGAAAPPPPPLAGRALLDWPLEDSGAALGPLAEALAGCAGEALLLALKVQLLCAAFIGVRASLPRKRFDQLVLLCWKYLFPLVLSLVLALVALGQAITLALLLLPPCRSWICWCLHRC